VFSHRRLHFGNWFLVATRAPLIVRVTRDRDTIVLDVAPEHQPKPISEANWFNWDVVARALRIDLEPSAFVKTHGRAWTQPGTKLQRGYSPWNTRWLPKLKAPRISWPSGRPHFYYPRASSLHATAAYFVLLLLKGISENEKVGGHSAKRRTNACRR
jgi:hypothetical protein